MSFVTDAFKCGLFKNDLSKGHALNQNFEVIMTALFMIANSFRTSLRSIEKWGSQLSITSMFMKAYKF